MENDPNLGQSEPQPDRPYSEFGPTPPPTPTNPYGAPENPFAAPQNSYGYSPPNSNGPIFMGYSPVASAPLPLGEAIRGLPNQYIRVLTKPGAMSFMEEQSKASWDIVWVQLLIYAVIGTILAYVGTLTSTSFFNFNSLSGTSSTVNQATLDSIHAITLGVAFSEILIIPAIFFIGQAILFGLSKAFGGQGRFVNQSYSFLLFMVPLGIISDLLGLIPFAGSILAIAIGVYEIVLSVFAIMAVQRLSGGKASAVVLIPVGVAVLLACVFIFVAVFLFAAALQNAR